MLQIELFSNPDLSLLQADVNNFLSTLKNATVQEIKIVQESQSFYPIIMIIYASEE